MDTNFLSQDFRQLYLARRSKDLQDCDRHLSIQNWSYFENLGHQLKGNAPSYGYKELQKIAVRIEFFAQKKDLSCLEKSIHEFKKWLANQKISTPESVLVPR